MSSILLVIMLRIYLASNGKFLELNQKYQCFHEISPIFMGYAIMILWKMYAFLGYIDSSKGNVVELDDECKKFYLKYLGFNEKC